jgi:RNA polymerase sigma-70 factor (ECF subfamily)
MDPAAFEPADEVKAGLDGVVDSDAELLRRIARRDRDALERLYRRYARPVYGLALRRLRAPSDAAAATERTFAAIWSSAATYVPERESGARWLFTIACDTIAGQAGAEPAEDGWPAFRVHAAVVDLPERERVPVELGYWAGRSRSEIAELLGLPVATVELRTRSALARLAAGLEDVDGRAHA